MDQESIKISRSEQDNLDLEKKIIKLLKSGYKEDIKIGMELLKASNLPLEGAIKATLFFTDGLPSITDKYLYKDSSRVKMRDPDDKRCKLWEITWK